MNKKLAIWGWWQGRNLGDQWIKHVMKTIFPEAVFIDTSVTDFSKYYFVICGGGGLFVSDVYKVWKTAYRQVHYGMIGLGAEFMHKTNEAYKVCQNADFFYVRDRYSLRCMKIFDQPRSYDITFYDPLPLCNEEELMGDRCFFVWRSPDEWMLTDKFFIEYQKADYDYYAWEKVVNKNFKCVVQDDLETYDYNIMSKIKDCNFIISGRYHGIVAAVQRGIPCIAIDVCPKIRALMQEVGIEKYCIKYSELEKLDGLIYELKSDWKIVRQLQISYRTRANEILTQQIQNAKFQIKKVKEPLKIIHYGSYYFGKNDVVKVMADALKESVETVLKEIRIGKGIHNSRIKAVLPTDNSSITILNNIPILMDIIVHRPDAIILNSGGLILDKMGIAIVKRLNIKLIGIELSDPDVFPYNGKIYAKKFDLFYTNARYSRDIQYKEIGVSASLLGFAASSKHHYYLPNIAKKYDVVIVGGGRPDRIPIVNELRRHFNVGLYGSGWENSLGFVSGRKQVEAINSGKIYISFSRTMAGYNNVKVGLFEAIACKAFVITENIDELSLYFNIGDEIICYNTMQELVDKIAYYLNHDQEREQIAENAYQRFLNEHTYLKRWDLVLEDIYNKFGEN